MDHVGAIAQHLNLNVAGAFHKLFQVDGGAAERGSGFGLGEAVGAFVICGGLIVLAGATRTFERVMDRIPQAIAAALLAGVLARFGLDAMKVMSTDEGYRLRLRGMYAKVVDPGTIRPGDAITTRR